MTHDEMRELTGAYALGTLTDDERRTFEAHAASCVECAGEVRAFMAVARGLDRAVDRREPPPALRARVLAHVADLAATSPTPRAARARRVAPAWLAAAAALAAIAIGLYAASLRGRIGALDAELTDARARTAQIERTLEEVRQQAALAARATEILAAADVATVSLAGQAPAPGASGRAYWSRSRGVLFTATNLPALPPGRVYQLWIITGDRQTISVGLFRPDAAGGPASLAAAAVAAPNPVALAVTEEPEGGVPAPTGQIYLVGQL
jgi:anti-sigma-K factor RskA